MGSSSPRLVLIEVERSCAVLLRVLFLIVMCVSSRRRGILSAVVQVSCQLRKHVACGHASVMICVMSLGNIIIGQTRSVCEVRCRRIPRRDTARRSKVGLFVVVSCAMWVFCCVHTSLEGQTSCVFVFFSTDSTPTMGVRWRWSAMCIDEVLCAFAHLFLCQHLGQCHVLPLMVLGSVGCNTMEENNTYRPLCKVLLGVSMCSLTHEKVFLLCCDDVFWCALVFA